VKKIPSNEAMKASISCACCGKFLFFLDLFNPLTPCVDRFSFLLPSRLLLRSVAKLRRAPSLLPSLIRCPSLLDPCNYLSFPFLPPPFERIIEGLDDCPLIIVWFADCSLFPRAQCRVSRVEVILSLSGAYFFFSSDLPDILSAVSQATSSAGMCFLLSFVAGGVLKALISCLSFSLDRRFPLLVLFFSLLQIPPVPPPS